MGKDAKIVENASNKLTVTKLFFENWRRCGW